jgi:hypothetical protein
LVSIQAFNGAALSLHFPIPTHSYKWFFQSTFKATSFFEAGLPFSSAMEGVCSARVQAQNKHSRVNLQVAFADINICESWSAY